MAPRDLEQPPEADRFGETPHPRETFNLFGHAETERALLQSYRNGTLPQAFLFGGPSGIGKATLAWRLARFILAHPDPAARQVLAATDLFVAPDHPVARQIVSLSHADLMLLRREWNEKTKKPFTDIRVDDIRRAIHMFQQAAGAGGYRIAILDSAEDLNTSGANALLKLIEEPPPRSLFLIVAHRPGQVLATIRSRCRKLQLKPLMDSEILATIESLGAPWSVAAPADRAAAISVAKGSLHEVLRRLGGQGGDLDERIRQMLEALPQVDWRNVHDLADHVVSRENGADYDMMLGTVYDWLSAQVRRGAEEGEGGGINLVRRLAPFAEVWEKVTEAARETEVLNLDKRPLVLSIFADLAAAARASSF